MVYQAAYEEGETISRSDARQIASEYLDRLEAKWRAAGLPCIGFVEKPWTLQNELLEEIEKVYTLTDC